MLYFENDYCEGAHPAILQKLTETNFEKVSGYGTDPYCASARAEDPRRLRLPGGRCAVHLRRHTEQRHRHCVHAAALAGRSWPLPPAMLAAHEAGAIEYTGHKVITLPAARGQGGAPPMLRELVRHLLRRRQPRPHGVPRHGVHLPPHRSTAPCTPRQSWKPCTPSVRSTSCRCSWTAHGWATAWLAKGTDVTLAGPCPADRCVLHRRHQGGCAVRRSRGVPPRCTGPLYDHGQAAGRTAGKGPAAGHPVRCAVHR